MASDSTETSEAGEEEEEPEGDNDSKERMPFIHWKDVATAEAAHTHQRNTTARVCVCMRCMHEWMYVQFMFASSSFTSTLFVSLMVKKRFWVNQNKQQQHVCHPGRQVQVPLSI